MTWDGPLHAALDAGMAEVAQNLQVLGPVDVGGPATLRVALVMDLEPLLAWGRAVGG